MEKLEQEIRALIAEVIESEPDEINPEAKFVEDLGMDSMMALEILAGIEKKYKITIPEDYLPKFTTLSQTLALVKGIMTGECKQLK